MQGHEHGAGGRDADFEARLRWLLPSLASAFAGLCLRWALPSLASAFAGSPAGSPSGGAAAPRPAGLAVPRQRRHEHCRRLGRRWPGARRLCQRLVPRGRAARRRRPPRGLLPVRAAARLGARRVRLRHCCCRARHALGAHARDARGVARGLPRPGRACPSAGPLSRPACGGAAAGAAVRGLGAATDAAPRCANPTRTRHGDPWGAPARCAPQRHGAVKARAAGGQRPAASVLRPRLCGPKNVLDSSVPYCASSWANGAAPAPAPRPAAAETGVPMPSGDRQPAGAALPGPPGGPRSIHAIATDARAPHGFHSAPGPMTPRDAGPRARRGRPGRRL
jgi:hypothetical protein